MITNKQNLLTTINNAIKFSQTGNKEDLLYSIGYFVNEYRDFNLLIETLLKDSTTSWNEFKELGVFFSILYDYSNDSISQSELCRDASRCFARAFILCPFREKHPIAYEVNKLIDKTYNQFRLTGDTGLTYSSVFINLFIQDISDISDLENELEYKWGSSFGHRYTNLLQLNLQEHIIKYNNYTKNPLILDKDKLKTDIEKYKYNLNGLTKSQMKKLATEFFSTIFYNLCVSDEDINELTLEENEFWEYDKDYATIRHLTFKEAYECGYFHPKDSCYYDDDDDEIYVGNKSFDYEDEPTYERYAGSYVQDEMGWSDDDIDTVLDGEPDAYWNID